jgi:His/Glu/Gln/Arg/opine family amino acid ABC transporter permease subunit
MQVVLRYLPYLAKGIAYTAGLSGLSIAIGLALGLVVCLLANSRIRAVSLVANLYIHIFRNTPRLVLLIYVYFCTAMFTGVQIEAYASAVLAFGLLSSAFMAEVFRAGIIGVKKGEIEAARGLGMSTLGLYRRIILPQALRTIIPALVNQSVVTIKTTTIASMIGVKELVYRAGAMATITFRPLELYTTIAVMFIAMCMILSRIAVFLERRLTRYRG